MVSPEYRALICVTTCQRLSYLRRYLPLLARACVQDSRFSLLVALDGSDADTRMFCVEWDIPILYAERQEGVGLSKNRVLERFADFDYYFFLEDDVELVDAAVFAAHVEMSRASGIHHFSLFERRGARKRIGESVVAGHRVVHALFGGADFNFFTADGLRQVGGWHSSFAAHRRWGHTEHSYRFPRSGLAPAPFNVAVEFSDAFVWHTPPSVTRSQGILGDEDQIAAPERELMDQELRSVPVQTLAPYRLLGASFAPPIRLAAALNGGDRYPLVDAAERRKCLSGFHVGRFESDRTARERAGSLVRAGLYWPTNPALRHLAKTALKS